jgi:alpha-mannosidase
MHAIGCYAAHSAIKRANRRAEWALLEAERLDAAARLALDADGGDRAPADVRLAGAWRDVLFCQFHDIMAGSCERAACDEALGQFGRAAFTATEITAEAAQRIGGLVDTRGEGRALLVFNPHAFPVDCLVETDDVFLRPYREDIGALHVRDSAGTVVPHQRVRPSSRTQCPRLLFPARLPALGWRTFRLVAPLRPTPQAPEGSPPDAGRLPGQLDCSDSRMENAHLRLDLDADGRVQLRDKARGWDALAAGAGAALVLDDPSDTWSHGLRRFDGEAGSFTLLSRELLEAGPLRGRLRLHFAFGASRLRLDYVLERFACTVRMEAELDWREERRLLKLVFPVALEAPVWTSEAPYGEAVRPADGAEAPMGGWTDLSAGACGLAVANDSKYSLDARDGTLRLTVARSPAYAHHEPHPLVGGERFLDHGIQDFRLLLIPHGPDWRPEAVRLSHLLNCPPVFSPEGTHPGRLPADGSAAIEVRGPAVAMALKRGEDGTGWALRLFNPEPHPADCAFAVPALGRSWQGRLRGGEVATFLLPDEAGVAVRRTDFLED